LVGAPPSDIVSEPILVLWSQISKMNSKRTKAMDQKSGREATGPCVVQESLMKLSEERCNLIW
jgi:hypothetical protein